MRLFGKEKLRCSFCCKDQDNVTYLIAGPPGIYICGACVDICVGIIDKTKASGGAAPNPA